MGLKLNLGCGRNAIEGWVNVDAVALPGVAVVADLARFGQMSDIGINDSFMNKARYLGLKVQVWTINDADEMRTLMHQYKVDGMRLIEGGQPRQKALALRDVDRLRDNAGTLRAAGGNHRPEPLGIASGQCQGYARSGIV